MGGIPHPDFARRHRLGHHTTGADNRSFSDSDAAQNSGAGSNRSVVLDDRRDHRPVIFGLEFALFGYGAGIAIVNESHAVSDKNPVSDNNALTEEGMARNFTVRADEGVFLDFHKSADLGSIANGATVEVDETEDFNVLSQYYIGSNAHVIVHIGILLGITRIWSARIFESYDD